MRKKLYRVYLTIFDPNEFEKLVKTLRSKFSRIEVHQSKLVPEFKFIEIYEERSGLEDLIKRTILDALGRNDITIRIDRISI